MNNTSTTQCAVQTIIAFAADNDLVCQINGSNVAVVSTSADPPDEQIALAARVEEILTAFVRAHLVPERPLVLEAPKTSLNLVHARFAFSVVAATEDPGLSWVLDRAHQYRQQFALGYLQSEIQASLDLLAWRNDCRGNWCQRKRVAMKKAVAWSFLAEEIGVEQEEGPLRVKVDDMAILKALYENPLSVSGEQKERVLRQARASFAPLVAVEHARNSGLCEAPFDWTLPCKQYAAGELDLGEIIDAYAKENEEME